MLLSQILQRMAYDMPYSIRNEQAFDRLALCASEAGAPSCIFIDREAFLPAIKPSVAMVLTNASLAERILARGVGVCICDQPRLLFFRLHNSLCQSQDYVRAPFPSEFGEGCSVSPMSSVAPNNVRIGARTVIEEFVVIRENTVVGDDCVIRAGTIIGGEGFEFKRDQDTVLPVTHAGGVVLGDRVEIQQQSCIDRAIYPWDDTMIGDESKIDNRVYIAHAVKIGRCTLIAGGTSIGGRTRIGDRCWVGLGASIVNGTTIGSDARVNMGAVVTRPVPDGGSVSGNFAIDHRAFIARMKRIASQV